MKAATGIVRRVAIAAWLGMAWASLADMEIEPRAPERPAGREHEVRLEKRRATGEPGAWPGMEGGALLERLMDSPRVVQALGLAEEDLAGLRTALRAIEGENIDLDAQIRKLALEQTELTAKLLAAPAADPEPLMKLADDIGRARIQQAKLAIKRLVIVRQHLTPEQIRKARTMMSERLEKARELRNAERPDQNQRPAARQEKIEKKEKREAVNNPPPPKPPEGW